jgi:CheY-like chemotaxis protein/HPt (histidine-containing phosphotransfer) domain-containing protein
MDLTEFLSEFQLEAGEKLDLMASQLLRLERDSNNPQPIREMFLAAHTIKGGAAMLRLTDVEALAHAVEDLLSTFRDDRRTLDSAMADLVFQSIDQLRNLVTCAAASSVGAELNPEVERFAADLRGGDHTPAPAAPTSMLVPAAPAVPAVPVVPIAPAMPVAPRALLVDDSATVRELHRLLLSALGYDVVALDDGQAAYAVAIASQFGLIVSGVLVKSLSGFELCGALRDADGYREVPFVLISADADPDLARRAAEAGVTVVVRKGSLHDGRFSDTVRDLTVLMH